MTVKKEISKLLIEDSNAANFLDVIDEVLRDYNLYPLYRQHNDERGSAWWDVFFMFYKDERTFYNDIWVDNLQKLQGSFELYLPQPGSNNFDIMCQYIDYVHLVNHQTTIPDGFNMTSNQFKEACKVVVREGLKKTKLSIMKFYRAL